MSTYVAEPVEGYEDDIFSEYHALSLPCADGLQTIIERLSERNPGDRDLRGWIDGDREIFAIPLPNCAHRLLVVSIGRGSEDGRRLLHGTVASGTSSTEYAKRLVTEQLRLIHPSWEPVT